MEINLGTERALIWAPVGGMASEFKIETQVHLCVLCHMLHFVALPPSKVDFNILLLN